VDLEISVIQNFPLILIRLLVRWSLGFDQDNHNTAPPPRRAEAEETLGSLNHEKNSTFQQQKTLVGHGCVDATNILAKG